MQDGDTSLPRDPSFAAAILPSVEAKEGDGSDAWSRHDDHSTLRLRSLALEQAVIITFTCTPESRAVPKFTPQAAVQDRGRSLPRELIGFR